MFGVGGTLYLALNNILSGRFFLVFSPIFMTYQLQLPSIFGVILFATEMKIDIVL